MIKVLFICHGNICRSPMAEFIFKDMVEKAGFGDAFEIASAATSREEIGNPVHPGTRRILESIGINCQGKYAVQITKKDYAHYDYLICMDSMNLRNMRRITGEDTEHKMYKLLEFAGRSEDVADPWYTGNFDVTYRDVCEGCRGLLEHILKEQGLLL